MAKSLSFMENLQKTLAEYAIAEAKAKAEKAEMELETFDEYIARLDAFITENNAVVKNHHATILKWYNEDRAVKV